MPSLVEEKKKSLFFYGTLGELNCRWNTFIACVADASSISLDDMWNPIVAKSIYNSIIETINPRKGFTNGILVAFPWGFPAARFGDVRTKVYGTVVDIPQKSYSRVFRDLCLLEGYDPKKGEKSNFYPKEVTVTLEEDESKIVCSSFEGNLDLLFEECKQAGHPTPREIKTGEWKDYIHIYSPKFPNKFWHEDANHKNTGK